MRRGFLYRVTGMGWFTLVVLVRRIVNTLEADFCVQAALLRKSRCDQSNPFSGQTYAMRCVSGLRRAVKRLRISRHREPLR